MNLKIYRRLLANTRLIYIELDWVMLVHILHMHVDPICSSPVQAKAKSDRARHLYIRGVLVVMHKCLARSLFALDRTCTEYLSLRTCLLNLKFDRYRYIHCELPW